VLAFRCPLQKVSKPNFETCGTYSTSVLLRIKLAQHKTPAVLRGLPFRKVQGLLLKPSQDVNCAPVLHGTMMTC
jgi:hypothetical protein